MRYLLFLIILLCSSFSFAQEDDESLDNIEEVVTSAFRKETALQDTGLAVTVITATDIESKNLKEFYDFQFNVPGVQFQKGNFSGTGVRIRGLSNYAVGGSFSGVATYRLDDNNVGATSMAIGELWDIDSFEVLRGPQGTLYGGNNPAGTFLISSKDPGAEVDGYFRAEFGDLDMQRYTAAFTINAGEKFRTRVSVRSLTRDGYVQNVFNGTDVDDRKFLGVRVKSIFDFSDDTSATLTLVSNNMNDSRNRTQRAACNSDPIMGCEQWGDSLPLKGSSHSGVTAFGTVDFLTLNYPGDLIAPDLRLSYNDDAVYFDDLRKISTMTNPRLQSDNTNASLNIEHLLNDVWTMNFIAANYHQDYDHMQSLNGFVSTRPYRMGPVIADLFGTGTKSYQTDEPLDAAQSNFDDQQYELRFSSDFGGATEVVTGLWHELNSSFTNYRVQSPGFTYFSDVGVGPIGRKFPDLAQYGGLGFWANYFGAYQAVGAQAIPAAILGAAVAYVGADPTTPAQIAALIPQLLASGACADVASCTALAQQVLVGNAAALPSVLFAGTTAGVEATHQGAAQAIRGIAALGPNFALAGAAFPVGPALPAWQQQFQSWNKTYRDTWGAFAEFTHELDDRTNITAGARFNAVIIKDYVMDGVGDASGSLSGYNGTVNGFPILPEYSAELDEFTGRVIIDRKYDNGTLLYVKYDRGLKSGGFNPTTTSGADNAVGVGAITLVDPEIHNVIEIGSKGRYLGGALTVNASYYYNQVEGMHLNKIIGLASETFNADVDLSGIEMEVLFIPNAFTRLNFVGAYNSSEIVGYLDFDPRNPYGASSSTGVTQVVAGGTVMGMTDVGPLFRSFGGTCATYFNALLNVPCTTTPPLQDLAGLPLPGAPELSYTLGAEMDLMNNDNGLVTARVDYIYRDGFFLDVFQNSHAEVESFSFVNVDLSYTPPSANWGIEFYMHNIEDKDVVVGGFVGASSNGGGYNLYFQEPMTGGLSIIYNF
ncbi:MAG: TonB-dependent receptor plug domain-containing protein [SAR86 cluster bacterium]|nr:TonB-dependent receptor plug domain-containing protein [SAR86 cluster bacterium]